MNAEINDVYYQKYLKYKTKYADLKQHGGLITLKNGVYAFFCSADVANLICATLHGNSPANAKLNELLAKSGPAYRGKNGDLKLTIVKESYLKKSQKKTGQLAYSAASATGSALGRAASVTGDALGRAASATGSALGRAASATGAALGSAGAALGSAASATGAALGSAASATGAALGRAASSLGSSIYQGTASLKNRVIGKTNKVNINDLVKNRPTSSEQNAGGDAPRYIELSSRLQTNNDSQLRETGNKLKAIDETINTVVVIEIKSIGSNICLNKISL